VPGSWLFGGRDVPVPTKTGVELLELARDGSSVDASAIVYPNAGHGLRDADPGTPIDHRFDTVEWLDAVGGR